MLIWGWLQHTEAHCSVCRRGATYEYSNFAGMGMETVLIDVKWLTSSFPLNFSTCRVQKETCSPSRVCIVGVGVESVCDVGVWSLNLDTPCFTLQSLLSAVKLYGM